VEELENQLAAKEELIQEMSKALAFYGNDATYQLQVAIDSGTPHPMYEPIYYDKGKIAKSVISKLGEDN